MHGVEVGFVVAESPGWFLCCFGGWEVELFHPAAKQRGRCKSKESRSMTSFLYSSK